MSFMESFKRESNVHRDIQEGYAGATENMADKTYVISLTAVDRTRLDNYLKHFLGFRMRWMAEGVTPMTSFINADVASSFSAYMQ